MEIIIQKKEPVKLKDIKPGELFKSCASGVFYLKTNEVKGISDDGARIKNNVTEIESGLCCGLCDDIDVMPVDAQIVVRCDGVWK